MINFLLFIDFIAALVWFKKFIRCILNDQYEHYQKSIALHENTLNLEVLIISL